MQAAQHAPSSCFVVYTARRSPCPPAGLEHEAVRTGCLQPLCTALLAKQLGKHPARARVSLLRPQALAEKCLIPFII